MGLSWTSVGLKQLETNLKRPNLIFTLFHFETLTFFVLCLSLPENGQQMKAVVQWFMRVSELPVNKLKLLGREPHPQEIFYYECRNCDNEVNVESILRPVKVSFI